jgi:hypothetical protein
MLLEGTDRFLEIPVTVSPFGRFPIHFSYLAEKTHTTASKLFILYQFQTG